MFCCCFIVCSFCFYISFFFFKQKTAYEMRISDWSSDVCSSDLVIRSIAPSYVSRMSPSRREYLAVDKLALPLIDADGRVNKILGSIYLSDRTSTRLNSSH